VAFPPPGILARSSPDFWSVSRRIFGPFLARFVVRSSPDFWSVPRRIFGPFLAGGKPTVGFPPPGKTHGRRFAADFPKKRWADRFSPPENFAFSTPEKFPRWVFHSGRGPAEKRQISRLIFGPFLAGGRPTVVSIINICVIVEYSVNRIEIFT
jgi:hypothetical protein